MDQSSQSTPAPLNQTRSGKKIKRVKNFNQLQADLDHKLSCTAQSVFYTHFLEENRGNRKQKGIFHYFVNLLIFYIKNRGKSKIYIITRKMK